MYYVITREDNKVIGITKDDAYSFNLPNVSIHEMDGEIPDLNQNNWDFELGEFVRAGSIYTKREFLNKFTLAERSAIRASTDAIVVDIMNMLELAEYIDVVNTETQSAVGYLAMVGLIASTRIVEILQ